MKRWLPTLGLWLMAVPASASSVLASTFGFSPTDATAAFQAAIRSGYDTVIFDRQATDWHIGPSNFFNIARKVFIFQPGVRVKALPGRFADPGACLLRFNNSQDLQIIGYGAEFKMNRAEYAALNNGEWRMSLSLWACRNVTIKGLVLNESGGDGLYIGANAGQYCENILVEDVQCLNHYRQGMSIISVQNMRVRHCLFANTQGALPEAGVDVEPDVVQDRIIDLRFENCAFKNNGWAGVALALFNLRRTSQPVSITLTDCYFQNNSRPENTYAHNEIHLSADNNDPVQGQVLFERCFIDSSRYAALYTRKTASAYGVKFKDCVFNQVSRLQIEYNEPIFLEVPSYDQPSAHLGGLTFDNVAISYPTDFAFFRVYGWSTLAGLKDVTGNFTVFGPNAKPARYERVPERLNVTNTATILPSPPPTTVNLRPLAIQALECNAQRASWSASRRSDNLTYPLGVT
jgi:hypothetical protein